MTDPSAPRAAPKKGNGFFAADINQFKRAVEIGLEPAVAYLALMAGTEQTNTISYWGINAITESTGLTRHEAKRAVDALSRAGLLEILDIVRKRARTLPRYRLPRLEARQPLATLEKAALDRVRAGLPPEANAAARASEKGWIQRVANRWEEVPAEADLGFLPNSFVRTRVGTSPLARILNLGEPAPLQLAVCLYHRQNLLEDRGVPPADLRRHFHADLRQLDDHPYKVVTLRPGRRWEDTSIDRSAYPERFGFDRDTVWPALTSLELCHIVEWTIYTTNGKSPEKFGFGRPSKPAGVIRNGRVVKFGPEFRAGLWAYLIGEHRNSGAHAYGWHSEATLMAIESASVMHAEGVGILRMTHKVDTQNTKAWSQNIYEESCAAIFFYQEAAEALGIEDVEREYEILEREVHSYAISR
jgi:hypothetical protein